MTKSAVTKFYENFFSDYNKKNYQKIIQSIPDLLKLKYGVADNPQFAKLCTFSFIVIRIQKSVDVTTLKNICATFKRMITSTTGFIAMNHFISFEYAVKLPEFPKAVDESWVKDMVTKILDYIQGSCSERTRMETPLIKKFIMLVIEIEALIGGKSADFPMATKTLEYFQKNVLISVEIESGWPALLIKTLETCRLAKDSKDTGIELLEQVRELVNKKNPYRQNITIMISQIIAACKSLVTRSTSLPFLHNIFQILGISYDIIRDKTVTSNQHYYVRKYDSNCCDKWEKHFALNILETVRNIFVIAMECNNFDEILVSSCVNFIVAEASVLEHLDCKIRSNLLWNLNESVSKITKNIKNIITACGKDRGIRTIKKFLSIQTKHKYLNYYNLTTELINIYDDTNDVSEKINLCAVRFCTANKGSIVYSLHQLHMIQAKLHSSKFETIPSILSKLDKNHYGMQLTFDSLKVLFLQLRIDIEWPKLNEKCRNKLLKELLNMDIYKNNTYAYVNLIKGNVGVLQCMIDIAYYESIVTSFEHYGPFNQDVMTLKFENNLITMLQGALDCFSKFLRDRHIWTSGEEKDEYISNMETMLQKVGQWLMIRQYKELAIEAYDLLYQVAKLSGNSFKQIIAGGYLLENISLHPNSSIEEEIVTDLQNNIIKKFKEVDAMSEPNLNSFLLAFLQLSMYTLRFKNNMEHVKKYMQAITKLLDKHDSDKQKFVAIRLKYSELMFEMILIDSSAIVTPTAFVEDIFHRFKNIRYTSPTDVDILPGIVYDIVKTLYGYTHARFEFHKSFSLIWTLIGTSARKGYIFLLAKVKILLSKEYLYTGTKQYEVHFSHLDVMFDCKEPNVQNGSAAPTVTWNKEVTPYIHLKNCDCFQCSQIFINLVKMEVADLKASANYIVKDYEKSLQCFQKVYEHWRNTNDTPYVSMLMNYSNCLISNSRINESKGLLSKALNSCNKSNGTHYAQAQDISHRLIGSRVRDELEIDVTPSYANAEQEYQAIVAARQPKGKPKKKTVSQSEPRALRTQKTTRGSKKTVSQRLYY